MKVVSGGTQHREQDVHLSVCFHTHLKRRELVAVWQRVVRRPESPEGLTERIFNANSCGRNFVPVKSEEPGTGGGVPCFGFCGRGSPKFEFAAKFRLFRLYEVDRTACVDLHDRPPRRTMDQRGVRFDGRLHLLACPGAFLPHAFQACSDHSVNLMKEEKNRRGCTHGYRCEVKYTVKLPRFLCTHRSACEADADKDSDGRR